MPSSITLLNVCSLDYLWKTTTEYRDLRFVRTIMVFSLDRASAGDEKVFNVVLAGR